MSGLEKIISAIRDGEEMLLVRNVDTNDLQTIAEELKMNMSLLAWVSSVVSVFFSLPDSSIFLGSLFFVKIALLYA